MPVYQYECVACGHIVEELRPIEERDTDSECPIDNEPCVLIISAHAKTPNKWKP